MPKIKRPFWVVLAFGRAKWTLTKGKVGLSAKKLGRKAPSSPYQAERESPGTLPGPRDTWALGGVEIGVRAKCMSPSVGFASSAMSTS